MTFVALDGYSIFIILINMAALIAIGALVYYLVRRYNGKA